MKRIICLLLCIMSIAACCSLTISAASEEASPSIMSELSNMTIGGKQFDEADYPVNTENTNMYILAAVEKGFVNTSVSNQFKFYIYVYNPSCIGITASVDNRVQIGVNVSCVSYNYYRLKLMSITNDHRFAKFEVMKRDVSMESLWKNQSSVVSRVYNIVKMDFFVNGEMLFFSTTETFTFTGFDYDNSLVCDRCGLDVLGVELHSTNWISPNAGAKVDGSEATIYDHYEINSVYFSIPEKYFKDGTWLTSIRATYDALHLTPIIVTNSYNFKDDKGKITREAIENGTVIAGDGDIDIYDIVGMGDSYWIPSVKSAAWCYSESVNVRASYLASGSTIYDRLAYFFESKGLPENFDFEYGQFRQLAISSEELEEYFYQRYNSATWGSDPNLGYLYSERESRTIDYNGELLNMSTYMSGLSNFKKWWTKLTKKDDSYLFEDFNVDNCQNFRVIDNPSAYASITTADYEKYADDLYIGVNDVGDFSEFCAEAAAKNERVVLLRFGFSDYTCAPIYDCWELMASPILGDPIGAYVEKWAFMNISVAQLTFKCGTQLIVVPVCSNTVDSYGDVYIYEDPNDTNGLLSDDPDWWAKFLEKLKETLKKIGKVFLIVLAIIVGVPILLFLIKLINRLIGLYRMRSKEKRTKRMHDEHKDNKRE